MKIAVTGATGFVGKHLVEYLLANTDWNFVGLSRSQIQSEDPRLEFKKCDLYSLLEAEEALEDVDVAIYLVHSMLPSSRLSQGGFEDFDFILADNFAKAAKRQKVKHIIYIGGIVPEEGKLSKHLESRLEVENTLKNSGVGFTALRCALVLGADGSSFQILSKLVDKLKVLVLPSWTKTETQVTYIGDLVQVIEKSCNNSEVFGKSYDIGSDEIVSYKYLIKTYAKQNHKKRFFFNIGFVPLSLSKGWVSGITGVSSSLVFPLVDSLLHKMTVSPGKGFPKEIWNDWTKLSDALKSCGDSNNFAEIPVKRLSLPEYRVSSLVQSVQRLPMPDSLSIHEVAYEYMLWLPRFLGLIFKLKIDQVNLSIGIQLLNYTLLEMKLSEERTFPGRSLFYIAGGALSKPHPKARLEFRQGPDKKFLIAAIHSFKPKLPWYVYRFTQAIFHKMVMKAFDFHLRAIAKDPRKSIIWIQKQNN